MIWSFSGFHLFTKQLSGVVEIENKVLDSVNKVFNQHFIKKQPSTKITTNKRGEVFILPRLGLRIV